MTRSPATCRVTTSLPDIARLMIAQNCGCIPVVDGAQHPIGVVTDRDIVCRTIAHDRNPLDLTAADCMTECCVTVTPETSFEYCCELLERDQIRRALVIDDEGRLCGIVAQADVARRSEVFGGEVVAAVSKKPSSPASS